MAFGNDSRQIGSSYSTGNIAYLDIFICRRRESPIKFRPLYSTMHIELDSFDKKDMERKCAKDYLHYLPACLDIERVSP